MSEKTRQKKDGERKEKKNQRRRAIVLFLKFVKGVNLFHRVRLVGESWVEQVIAEGKGLSPQVYPGGGTCL